MKSKKNKPKIKPKKVEEKIELLQKDDIDYLNSLDIWIVSHGGCGSNYIADLLEENNINVRLKKGRINNYNYGKYCHLSFIPKDVKTKILYVYGDLINSAYSQEKRNILQFNLHKLKSYHNHSDSNDPFNYLFQYNNFYNNENVISLKYPYSKNDLVECFKKLKINISDEKIQIKKRENIFNEEYLNEASDDMKKIFEFYKGIKKII